MTTLLEVRKLSKHYPARDGNGLVKAVNDVSLALEVGRTLGIVGESGCGKSTLARLILRLIEPTAGTIHFNGENLVDLASSALRRRRRDIQIVFQDPYASLDPRMNVASIIAEPLDIHGIGSKAERKAKVLELLDLVGLDPNAASNFPHEFSGGQRQRIGIARAIALEPKLVVLDEPVSALDVSIQSQILNLLIDLKQRLGLSYIFISHDLSVVEHVSDDVAVMYLGQIVEHGKTAQVLRAPLHPYSQALISAIPEIDPKKKKQRIVLTGDPPNPEDIPPGCPFHPRCRQVMGMCRHTPPALRVTQDREVACHLYS
ncbi:MAG TPA: dipeptide ABC transporter ATP-binding protein [Aestuariivirga sp.]